MEREGRKGEGVYIIELVNKYIPRISLGLLSDDGTSIGIVPVIRYIGKAGIARRDGNAKSYAAPNPSHHSRKSSKSRRKKPLYTRAMKNSLSARSRARAFIDVRACSKPSACLMPRRRHRRRGVGHGSTDIVRSNAVPVARVAPRVERGTLRCAPHRESHASLRIASHRLVSGAMRSSSLWPGLTRLSDGYEIRRACRRIACAIAPLVSTLPREDNSAVHVIFVPEPSRYRLVPCTVLHRVFQIEAPEETRPYSYPIPLPPTAIIHPRICSLQTAEIRREVKSCVENRMPRVYNFFERRKIYFNSTVRIGAVMLHTLGYFYRYI